MVERSKHAAAEMPLKVTTEFLEGRNNPYRVTMTIPADNAEGVETIVTRVDAKSEKAATAEGFARIMRALGRRGRGPTTMALGRETQKIGAGDVGTISAAALGGKK